MSAPRPIMLFLGFLTLSLVVALAVWWRWPSAAPVVTVANPPASLDPRTAYTGPYQNIHPSVGYVGDAACARCHEDKAATYRDHPMGRSLFPVADAPLQPPLDAKHHNPFSALNTNLRVERAGARTIHREFRNDPAAKLLYDFEFEVKYAIGSGTHGQSYLWEQDGYVMQSPITWYGQKQFWDASPGWVEVGGGRPVIGRCLFCHANRVEPLPGYANRYAAPIFRGHTIGCERCHGPGEKHAARRNSKEPVSGSDMTIVNPRNLGVAERDAICNQCHLEGENRVLRRGRELFDFRPGLPLDDFWAVVVRTGSTAEQKVVNHVEQMEQSRCFQAGRGENKMGCISCHDPHVKPAAAARVAYFRQACLNCHDSKACKISEPQRRQLQPQDSCFECHMPKRSAEDAPHVAATDHRIPRRPKLSEKADAPNVSDIIAGLPVRLFHRDANVALSDEEKRDLAVAMAELLSTDKLAPRYARQTLALLDEVLPQLPADAAAWEAKGTALDRANRPTDAYNAMQEALKLEPDRESALIGAATIAMRLGKTAEAIELWQRVRTRNPWRPIAHGSLALLFADQKQWAKGLESSATWVRLAPGSPDARRMRAMYLLQTGDESAAAKQMAIIEAINPPNLAEIVAWWNEEMKVREKAPR